MGGRTKTSGGKAQGGAGWAPGQSGNPAGKPPLDKDLRRQCRAWTPSLAQRLYDIATQGKDQDAVKAIALLLAYGWGLPKQSIDIDAELKAETTLQLTSEERIKLIDEARKQLAAG